MKKSIFKRLSTLFIALILFLTMIAPIADAHSGRTDSNGGHKDNKNKSGLGYYHYHHGEGPHLHENGVCPYNKTTQSSPKTTFNSSTNTSGSTIKSTIKAAQIELNELGYNCGVADGIMGKKTRAALIKFQNDKGLKVDGILGPQSKKALGI